MWPSAGCQIKVTARGCFHVYVLHEKWYIITIVCSHFQNILPNNSEWVRAINIITNLARKIFKIAQNIVRPCEHMILKTSYCSLVKHNVSTKTQSVCHKFVQKSADHWEWTYLHYNSDLKFWFKLKLKKYKMITIYSDLYELVIVLPGKP